MMNTGLPRSAASDALPPVTVGPAVAGACRGAAASAAPRWRAHRRGRTRASRRIMRPNVPASIPSAALRALKALVAADTEDMRRFLALPRPCSCSRRRRRCPRRLPAVAVDRRPGAEGRALVGRCPDQGRHGRRDSRRRSGDLQAGRPAHPRRAGRGARRLGKARPSPADPTRLVTMRELDAQLVGALGLLPARSGSESLRATRGSPRRRCSERRPSLGCSVSGSTIRRARTSWSCCPHQPATRAEAAYSLARALKLTAGQVAWLDQLSRTFSVPELGEWQRDGARAGASLRRVSVRLGRHVRVDPEALERHGPGGTVTVPGGFDCSGFVWRVYKTKPFPGAPLLGDMLKGRTTYAMSAEVKKPARIALADLQPGDVIFFGSQGASVVTGRGRAHRHLRRERLVRPLVERRRHAAAAAGLVHEDVRLGPAAARSRPGSRPRRPRSGLTGERRAVSRRRALGPWAAGASVRPRSRPTSGALPAQCVTCAPGTVQSGSLLPWGPSAGRAGAGLRARGAAAVGCSRSVSPSHVGPRSRASSVAAPCVRPALLDPGRRGSRGPRRTASRRSRRRRSCRQRRAAPTVRELVGQRFVVAMSGTRPRPRCSARIRRGEIGGVILFGVEHRRARPSSRRLAATLQAGRPRRGAPAAPDRDRPGGRRGAPAAVGRAAPERDRSSAGWGPGASARRRGVGEGARPAGVNVDLAPVADVSRSGVVHGARASERSRRARRRRAARRRVRAGGSPARGSPPP